MRYMTLLLVACGLAVIQVSAQDTELSEEQKKIVAVAQKEQKKYPFDMEVLDSRLDAAIPQPVLFLGMCSGNLKWMLCWSDSAKLGPDYQIVARARWVGEDEVFEMRCPQGIGGTCAALAPGVYPAFKRDVKLMMVAPTAAAVFILANVDGKMKRVSYYRQGRMRGPDKALRRR